MSSHISHQAESARESARQDSGKFGAHAPGESGATLTVEDDSPVVEVDPGDTAYVYEDQGNDSPFDTIQATVDDDGRYRAFGTRYENFHHCIPDDTGEHFTDEERKKYLGERFHIIEGFVAERYDDVDINIDGDVPELVFNVELGSQAPTEQQASDAVWEGSSGVDFANEIDPGTFGHESAPRLIAERFAAYDAQKLDHPGPSDDEVEDFASGYLDTMRKDMALRDIDGEFSDDDGPTAGPEALDFDPETRAGIHDSAARFARENWGDIDYLSTQGDYGAMGSDLYMQTAETGISYTDRTSPTEAASVVSSRLGDSVEHEWSIHGPHVEDAEIGDDGAIHAAER